MKKEIARVFDLKDGEQILIYIDLNDDQIYQLSSAILTDFGVVKVSINFRDQLEGESEDDWCDASLEMMRKLLSKIEQEHAEAMFTDINELIEEAA